MEKEIRSLDIEFRNDENSREIDGYSIVWNSLSHNLGGFYERILPEAIDNVIERSDVKLLLNHNEERGILGRSRNGKGSLKLTPDEKGLNFRTKAPKTALGDEALEYLRRGDATQCSFAFTVPEGGDMWEKREDGSYLRTITKFDRLYDVSILTCTPAYEATSVSCRSFDEFKAHEAEELRKAQEEEAKRQAEEEAAKEAERQENIKKNWEKLVEENKKYMVPNQ